MALKNATLKTHKDLTHDVFELTFETEDAISFQAGQFITIKIGEQLPPCFRAYSIASSPIENGKEFKLCIKTVPGGRGSKWLGELKKGDQINFIGPNGHFTHKGEKALSFFIATGTGIAPFTSMIEDQIKQKSGQKMKLLFGVRHNSDIFYQDWLQELSENGLLESIVTLSKPEDQDWKGSIGRVTNVLKEIDLDAENTEFYICGLKDMIDEVVEILKAKGVPEDSINFEKYD